MWRCALTLCGVTSSECDARGTSLVSKAAWHLRLCAMLCLQDLRAEVDRREGRTQPKANKKNSSNAGGCAGYLVIVSRVNSWLILRMGAEAGRNGARMLMLIVAVVALVGTGKAAGAGAAAAASITLARPLDLWDIAAPINITIHL